MDCSGAPRLGGHVGSGRRLVGLHDGWRGNCSGPPPHLDPHVVSAPRRGHDEPLTCFAGSLYLLLDRAEIVQRAALFGRKDLPEHAEQRVRRQRTGLTVRPDPTREGRETCLWTWN